MEIRVIRKILTNDTTIGDLLINGTFICHTLEDKDRDLTSSMSVGEIKNIKVAKKTAIPLGSYRVTVTPTGLTGVGERVISGQKQLPLINAVKGYEGIRIHVGNNATATEGCLLVGMTKGTDMIGDSRTALNIVFNTIQTALANNETITITYSRETESDTRTSDESRANTSTDVSSGTNNQETSADETQTGQDLTQTFEQITANIGNQELSDTLATWGKKSSSDEDSDWIGLKQFLLYLATRYTPQSVFPFIELIPDITVDPTGYASEGETPEEVEDNTTGKASNKKNNLLSSVKNAATKYQNEIAPGFSQDRFNLTADVQSNSKGIADLYNLDPFKEGIDFIGEQSESGKKVFAQRGVGVRVFGQLVLSPSPVDGVASKPGAIGFQDLEIQAGKTADNGLTLIKMTLVDVQGNKFTDINSPWSFIYDVRPGNVGGDFWFRYGWQIRVPSPNDKDDPNSVKFWNHPGWAVFDDENGSFRNKIANQLIPGKNVITLTQSINTESNYTAGTLNLFDDGITFNEENGQVVVSRTNLDMSNYVKIALLNPELSMDDKGALHAALSFRTTGSIIFNYPLDFAIFTRNTLKKGRTITLGELILNVMMDVNNSQLIQITDSAERNKRRQYSEQNIKARATSRDFSNFLSIIGGEQGGNQDQIHPDQILLTIPKDQYKQLFTPQNSDDKWTILRWLRTVLQENECELLSAATGSGAGINSTWIIATTLAADKLYAKPQQQINRENELSNSPKQTTIQTFIEEKDVFSYRFQGSLITSLNVEKTSTPNAASIAANNQVADLSSLDEVNNNDEYNKPVTVADKKRNLTIVFSQFQNCTIECLAHPWLGPGKRIFIKGLGFFDGEYQVLEITHKLSGHKFTSSIVGARILKLNEDVEKEGKKDNKKFSAADGRNNFAQEVTKQDSNNLGEIANRNVNTKIPAATKTSNSSVLVKQSLIDKVK